MSSPTPPEKVLAAARKFAREKFRAAHRYAMVLRTDQQHPHVHLVVKAESEEGRRLYIDKEMLRGWREDFARLMREQGIAANATPRFARGRGKRKSRDAIYLAQQHGDSTVVHQRVIAVKEQLLRTGSLRDPLHNKLLETRKAVIAGWLGIADTLNQQGETILATGVRQFAQHLPKVLTDRERLAVQFAHFLQTEHRQTISPPDPHQERTR
jgi:Relaxase/Mobilisation nuclease domain